ncbi:hypothetical protein Dsin_016956 [Dipteronia sinensis]|uniref:Uncharacterized protein n=1 Tax=Dipteronia sinensis TaxID=43782 RepID=A0AAE0AE25_9ROSI|nr:hypothetical protein Dsin_016956 [Dipteronia sinensis]
MEFAELEKIFARLFIRAMDGHIDAASCMAKNPNYLKGLFSCSMDVDICLWDIASTAFQSSSELGCLNGLKSSMFQTCLKISLSLLWMRGARVKRLMNFKLTNSSASLPEHLSSTKVKGKSLSKSEALTISSHLNIRVR